MSEAAPGSTARTIGAGTSIGGVGSTFIAPTITPATEAARNERDLAQLANESNWVARYGIAPGTPEPLSFMNVDFPYKTTWDYLNAFAWWRQYTPPPPLPPGDDPVALAHAIDHLEGEVRRVETEFNTEIPRVWQATSFTVVGQRVLIYGLTLAIAGAAVGAAIGGPYGAVIGAAVGAVVGIVMGLIPWEASAFFYNWANLVDSMTLEERYGLWRNAHDAMNTARRTQAEPEFTDGWQFATNRAHILTGPVTDLTFLCYQKLLTTECFPPPPAPERIVVADMQLLTPVARYALGVFASTEPTNSTTSLEFCALWRNLDMGGTNQWLRPLFQPFRHLSVATIRRSLRQGVPVGTPGKPPDLNSFRDQPLPHYLVAAIAERDAQLAAEIAAHPAPPAPAPGAHS